MAPRRNEPVGDCGTTGGSDVPTTEGVPDRARSDRGPGMADAVECPACSGVAFVEEGRSDPG